MERSHVKAIPKVWVPPRVELSDYLYNQAEAFQHTFDEPPYATMLALEGTRDLREYRTKDRALESAIGYFFPDSGPNVLHSKLRRDNLSHEQRLSILKEQMEFAKEFWFKEFVIHPDWFEEGTRNWHDHVLEDDMRQHLMMESQQFLKKVVDIYLELSPGFRMLLENQEFLYVFNALDELSKMCGVLNSRLSGRRPPKSMGIALDVSHSLNTYTTVFMKMMGKEEYPPLIELSTVVYNGEGMYGGEGMFGGNGHNPNLFECYIGSSLRRYKGLIKHLHIGGCYLDGDPRNDKRMTHGGIILDQEPISESELSEYDTLTQHLMKTFRLDYRAICALAVKHDLPLVVEVGEKDVIPSYKAIKQGMQEAMTEVADREAQHF